MRFSVAAVEWIWHIQDSHGQILALTSRRKSCKPSKLSIPRSASAEPLRLRRGIRRRRISWAARNRKSQTLSPEPAACTTSDSPLLLHPAPQLLNPNAQPLNPSLQPNPQSRNMPHTRRPTFQLLLYPKPQIPKRWTLNTKPQPRNLSHIGRPTLQFLLRLSPQSVNRKP